MGHIPLCFRASIRLFPRASICPVFSWFWSGVRLDRLRLSSDGPVVVVVVHRWVNRPRWHPATTVHTPRDMFHSWGKRNTIVGVLGVLGLSLRYVVIFSVETVQLGAYSITHLPSVRLRRHPTLAYPAVSGWMLGEPFAPATSPLEKTRAVPPPPSPPLSPPAATTTAFRTTTTRASGFGSWSFGKARSSSPTARLLLPSTAASAAAEESGRWGDHQGG